MLSISDVAAATGLRPSALRYYEELGLINPAERRGGRRHYDEHVLTRLALIALCQQAGFTMAEVGQLFDGNPDARLRWRVLAEAKLVEIEQKMEQLRTMRRHLTAALECECGHMEGCELVEDAGERRRLAHQTSPD